jgi:hypothetical protein
MFDPSSALAESKFGLKPWMFLDFIRCLNATAIVRNAKSLTANAIYINRNT